MSRSPLRRQVFQGLLSAAVVVWVAAGCSSEATSTAKSWPQWRGPTRNDHSPDTGLLKSWPESGPKRVWLSTNTGLGYSGFAIVDGRLFTMGLRNDQEYLLALDAKTGKELWATPAGPKYPNNWGDGPRSTPTVDGDRVYALGGQGLLISASALDGKVAWSKSLVTDLGGQLQDWGYTEAPLVVGDTVVVTPGGSQGTLAALDKKSGAVRWRTPELTDDAPYSSPILITHEGRQQIVQLVMKRVFGVDPANGKVLWKQDFPGRVAVIPTPVYSDGIVFVTAGYGVGCAAVKLGTNHTVEPLYLDNKVMKNHHGGVVVVDGHLYGHSDGAGWICQDLKTGKEVWASKRFGKGAIHFADGMLYLLDERSGEVALVEASPKGWSEKSRFKLDPQTTRRSPQGGVWTHPVVLNGRLYLRDQELLSCYDVLGR
jgi:outer membrane protein assembly factor BamB